MINQKLRQLKARISKLQNWLKEEAENTEPPTLADYIQGKLKPVEWRLGTLKKHLEQADIYFKCKGKKPRKSERAFTVSCGRNSESNSTSESRI